MLFGMGLNDKFKPSANLASYMAEYIQLLETDRARLELKVSELTSRSLWQTLREWWNSKRDNSIKIDEGMADLLKGK
jgi:hypothetical protein